MTKTIILLLLLGLIVAGVLLLEFPNGICVGW